MPKVKHQSKNGKAKKQTQKQPTTAKTTMGKQKSGLIADVFNLNGRTTKTQLPEKVFKVEVKPQTVAQAVRVYLANQRKGTAKTQTRGEVSGGGRKPWRQKGTGRARQGSIRAPHWKGGGVVFGPTLRDFSLKLPKKMKQKAFFGAVSLKFAKGEVKIVDNFEQIKPKTKELAQALKKLNLPKEKKTLWVINGESENLLRAGRNLPNLSFCKASSLTVYQVMAAPILIFSKSAITQLAKRAD